MTNTELEQLSRSLSTKLTHDLPLTIDMSIPSSNSCLKLLERIKPHGRPRLTRGGRLKAPTCKKPCIKSPSNPKTEFTILDRNDNVVSNALIDKSGRDFVCTAPHPWAKLIV